MCQDAPLNIQAIAIRRKGHSDRAWTCHGSGTHMEFIHKMNARYDT